MVVAAAIGERLDLELQHVGHVQHDRLAGRDQPTHLVHHHRRGDDVAVQHQLAGHFQRVQANLTRHHQQFDEGAIALGLFEDAIAHKLNGDRQIPFAERHAIAQRAGFAFQDRQIMPGIADQLITPEAARVFGDHRAVGHDADLGRRAAHRDRAPGKRRRNAVAIAVQHDEAGAGDPQHMLHIAIERCGDPP